MSLRACDVAVRIVALGLAICVVGCSRAEPGMSMTAAPAEIASAGRQAPKISLAGAAQDAPASAGASPQRAAATQNGPNQNGPNQGGSNQSGPNQPVDPVSYLAYAYAISLELPGDRLIGVMEAHAAACRSAGLRVCQVVASRRDGDPSAFVQGALSLRAEPQWLQRFMKDVQNDARGAAGRVTAQSTTTEDLTRDIIDTEATLRARRALRDRLQQLLATRQGPLADLLSVERELARVQGELDSTESNLAAMRTRVSMSALTIDYASSARAVASDTFEPLRLSLVNFLVAVVGSTATLVTLIGGLLPWVAAGSLAMWLLLGIRRRRASRRAASPA
jgi:hypothetical protein